MSSTKNTKDNRQVVRVTYSTESIFEIPKELDLEDKSVVESWGVKYNTLGVQYVNGEYLKFAPRWDAADDQLKYPAECDIIPAEDTGYEYEEDEEEETPCNCKVCEKPFYDMLISYKEGTFCICEEELRKKLKEIDPGLKDRVISKWDMETLEKEYTKRLNKKQQEQK